MFPISNVSSLRNRHLSVARFAAVCAALGLAGSAHASNIVTDGGFESAAGNTVYYSGQSLDGAWNVVAGTALVESGDQYVYDGNNSLNLTYINPYINDAVSQVLTTVAGTTYTVSFYANSDTPNMLQVTANGTVVSGTPTSVAQNGFSDPVSNTSEFVLYTGTFYATSASTTLEFSDVSDPAIGSEDNSVMIDDVTVAATPEPASFALLLTGVSGIGALVRRSRILNR